MDTLYEESTEKVSQKGQWKREEVASKILDFEQAKSEQSQRQWCKEKKIPRTTLQYWLKRKKTIDASETVKNFFESPDGVAFLHRLIIAVHFEFSKHGAASIHNISNFLKLSGLSAFVGSSFGAHQKVSKNIDKALIEFGICEEQRLAEQMPEKKITICEDETFHPQVCLVAMEAKSNYILLEKYTDDRTGETWNKEIAGAIGDLPVEVIQSASDEGKGLLNHVEKGLKVHHSPDLFHVAYEITKGTSRALSSKVNQAEKQCQEVKEKIQKLKLKKEHYSQKKRTSTQMERCETRLDQAQKKLQQAETDLVEAKKNKDLVRTAKINIGRTYHPYDPLTGKKQDAHSVEKSLLECFQQIMLVAESFSENSRKHIEKARRVVQKMKATIAFFFYTINVYVQSLNETKEIEQLIHERLIPGFYLQTIAKNEKNPLRKNIISWESEKLLSILNNRDGPFADCDLQRIKRIRQTAKQCAEVFQRSSSCVEGRNAQLSLHHHGLHRLSDTKLQGLTVVHNFYIKRDDGTSAAERFFDAKPRDIFLWVLGHVSLPDRPRKKNVVSSGGLVG